MEVGHVVGRSRLVLVAGLLAIAVGLAVSLAPLSWVGAVLVALAFGANTVAKVQHYRELPLSPDARTKLVTMWLFFTVFVVALVVDAVASRTLAGYEGYFWVFVGMSVLLGGAYWVCQLRYLPEELHVEESASDE